MHAADPGNAGHIGRAERRRRAPRRAARIPGPAHSRQAAPAAIASALELPGGLEAISRGETGAAAPLKHRVALLRRALEHRGRLGKDSVGQRHLDRRLLRVGEKARESRSCRARRATSRSSRRTRGPSPAIPRRRRTAAVRGAPPPASPGRAAARRRRTAQPRTDETEARGRSLSSRPPRKRPPEPGIRSDVARLLCRADAAVEEADQAAMRGGPDAGNSSAPSKAGATRASTCGCAPPTARPPCGRRGARRWRCSCPPSRRS